MGTVSDKKKQTEILNQKSEIRNQNVYRADLTARGILRLLHSKREMHFFAFRNPSLSILLLSPQVVALTFQIRGLARCCVFCFQCKFRSNLVP